MSEGVPGQLFRPRHRPVVPTERAARVVEVSRRRRLGGVDEVDDFAGSPADDRHVRSTPATGEIAFGPAVREPDGDAAPLRRGAAQGRGGAGPQLPHRRRAGGATSPAVPCQVLQVVGPVRRPGSRTGAPAHGGVDGETIDEAKLRGPLLLRTRDRR